MSARLVAILFVALSVTVVDEARADDTVDYVVKPGDTCLGIAIRELGDRAKYKEIHRLNPGLGPEPHHLVPGSTLRIPRVSGGPDARLTGTSGEVRVRSPAAEMWNAAIRGMDLFRAWRVGAEDRASAELTFRDDQLMYLREHTIVVIFGPERRRARVTASRVELERGTLRTRLADLTADVDIETPSSVASVHGGRSLVSVDDDATSRVANHNGRAVDLRGKSGGRVRVDAGMGSRVKKGAAPEPPRKLLPAPVWIGATRRAVITSTSGATLAGSWAPVAKAAWYRLELTGPSNGDVTAFEVPATVVRFEIHRVPVGEYRIEVSAIDVDRFEGPPSSILAMSAIAVDGLGAPPAAPSSGTPLDTAQPSPPAPIVPRRAHIGGALSCRAGDHEGAPLTLDAVGPAFVTCVAADGTRTEPFEVRVAAVHATFDAGAAVVTMRPGDRRTLHVAVASDAPMSAAWRVEADRGLRVEPVADEGGAADQRAIVVDPEEGFAGRARLSIVDDSGAPLGELAVEVLPREQPPLAATPSSASRLRYGVFASGLVIDDDGAGLAGARGAYDVSDRVLVELETGVLATGVDADARWALALRAHAGVRLLTSRTGDLAITGGIAATAAGDDVRSDLSPGAAWTMPVGGVRLRVDLRGHLGPLTADVRTFEPELAVGIELDKR